MTEEEQFIRAKEKIKEMEKIANDKIEGETTTEVLYWEDGDFCIKVYHGFTDDNGQNVREEIIYKDSAGQIMYELQDKVTWSRRKAELLEDEWVCIDCGEEGNIIDVHGVRCQTCYEVYRE